MMSNEPREGCSVRKVVLSEFLSLDGVAEAQGQVLVRSATSRGVHLFLDRHVIRP